MRKGWVGDRKRQNCIENEERRYNKVPSNEDVQNKGDMIFTRFLDAESLLCSPRNGGCIVLKDAQVFLDAIAEIGDDVDTATLKVATTYGCAPDMVRGDVRDFIEMLKREGFLQAEDGVDKTPQVSLSPLKAFDFDGNEQGDSWTPLGDFYKRHNLPCELHIDLTDGCNERCIHCYIPKGQARFIGAQVFYKAVREFRDAQGMTLYVSGGECMLHPQFITFLRFARELNLNIIVMSNLTLCDERMVDALREIDPQLVNVSLYSMDAAIHDSITGVSGSWQKTMNAILALDKVGVPVRLATPIMRANKDSLTELFKFASDHHLHLIPDCDIIGRIDHDCSNQQCGLTLEGMESVITAHPKLFYKMPALESQCRCDARVCDIGEGKLNVNAIGEYYPCDGFHGMVLGTVAKDGILDVWRGGKLNSLRALKNEDFGECATCANRRWCKVCPMRNFNETGDMFRHIPERCSATAIRRKVFEGMKL